MSESQFFASIKADTIMMLCDIDSYLDAHPDEERADRIAMLIQGLKEFADHA